MTFMEEKKESFVWQYFLHSKEQELAKCKMCQKDIKCKGGTTSAMRSHLKSMHKINVSVKLVEESKQNVTKIDHFFKATKDSLAIILSELVVCDGIPIKVL